MLGQKRISNSILQSPYISRDLSWLKFNVRVLDQVYRTGRTLPEQLKFLAISASNLDEFFMIRIGSLYNYIDYGKERKDYSGLRAKAFRKKLLEECHLLQKKQSVCFLEQILPQFEEFGVSITNASTLEGLEREEIKNYFKKTIFPMLTPMLYDGYHTFPIIMNKVLTYWVITKSTQKKDKKKVSFVQIPQNLPRFYELEREDQLLFIPIESIIRLFIKKLFRNVDILSIGLFRITRNGDFDLEESDDIEDDFLNELKAKLKDRRTGRVVRIEARDEFNPWILKMLLKKWELEPDNVFVTQNNDLIDYTCLFQMANHAELSELLPQKPHQVPPLSYPDEDQSEDIFEVIRKQDILLHHPYNNIEPLLELIERAAEDPNVLSIKLTIYRLAKESRVSAALLRAAENGKHVSVLFEVKARFDEENNIREAQKLENAGCFVIYGISSFKTHTKLLLIVRKEGEKVTRYVHLSSGNYNELTSKLYTDLGILTTNNIYAHDVSEFFNVITGHSYPKVYKYLITAPSDMRRQLIEYIQAEAKNAELNLPCGIVLKINSLQDKFVIDELYKASEAGVPIFLIVRGICCLRPGRKGLSENIKVISIVGDYLEHSRIYYFHNNGDPKVYGGSADIMVRSFERRLESLFLIVNNLLKQQVINILLYNLKDNVNAYELQEDGTYVRKKAIDEPAFNIHSAFYDVTVEEVMNARLF